MTRPWMGGPRAEHLIFLCAFAPRPADLSCNADATWHGLVVGDEAVEAMMCCDAHLAIMTDVADYVHPLVHPCGIPGSLFRWPENDCYTDWDDTAEFTQVTEVTTPSNEGVPVTHESTGR